MTRDEFEQGYADRSGTTVESLRARGRVVQPCDCGAEGCVGWQMGYTEPESDAAPAPTTFPQHQQ